MSSFAIEDIEVVEGNKLLSCAVQSEQLNISQLEHIVGLNARTAVISNTNNSDDEIEESEEKEPYVAPIDRLITPKDVQTTITNEEEFIYVIGTRGAKVTSLIGLEDCHQLKEIVVRSCLLRDM